MFPIYWKDRECGIATLEKQGLYYRVSCKCNIDEDTLLTIRIHTLGQAINLGTCIKAGMQFIIDTKIPAKQINLKEIKFIASKKEATGKIGFVPVSDNLPFPNIQDLCKARMRRYQGKIGVIFIDSGSAKQDSGQTP